MFWFTYRVARTTARALTPRRRYYRRSRSQSRPPTSRELGAVAYGFGALGVGILLAWAIAAAVNDDAVTGLVLFLGLISALIVAAVVSALKTSPQPPPRPGFHGQPGHSCPRSQTRTGLSRATPASVHRHLRSPT
jgi:hypothetical protein